MIRVTDRQIQVLQMVYQLTADRGYGPSYRELSDALQIRSTNGVSDHIKALRKKGLLDAEENRSRTARVTDEGVALLREQGVATETAAESASASTPSTTQVPGRAIPRVLGATTAANDDVVSIRVLGKIAAGLPIEAVVDDADQVMVDASLLGRRRGEVFALKIEGESMIGDGILDGDLVFVQHQSTASTGEIVAAIVDGAATVKRYYRDGKRVRLEPSNPNMSSIWVDPDNVEDFRIMGKVIGVWRSVS